MKRFHFVSLLRRSPWGGSEELWSRTALWLLRHGECVSGSVRWWPEEIRKTQITELQRSGADLFFYGAPGSFFRNWLAEGINRISRKCAKGKLVKPMGYRVKTSDLVVFSSGGNIFPVDPVRFCRRRKQKYALIIQSVSESVWPRDDKLDDLRYVYEGAEAAFFVSRANRTSTIYQLGFEAKNFEVVSNPCNVSFETPFEWPRLNGHHEWAFVGRLEPGHKGIDLLLRAFAREHWKDRAVHLNIYGNGFSERSMKRMAEMLDLSSRVTFHGQISGSERIWRGNELLVLPSRHEGLPLAVTEAMLCGRPCVVTDVSGNREHFEDGISGFLAGGPTVDEVDRALNRAWENRDELGKMGRAAYSSIRDTIPRDPVGVFSERLLQLVEGKETVEVHR